MIAAGYVFEPPTHFTTTNSRELYGLREGETVTEAIARHQAGQVRTLADDELAELRQDMAEASGESQPATPHAEFRQRIQRKNHGVQRPGGKSMAHHDNDQEEPAFLDDEGPLAELPPVFTTTNIREMYGWRPGETLEDAIARHDAEQAGKVRLLTQCAASP